MRNLLKPTFYVSRRVKVQCRRQGDPTEERWQTSFVGTASSPRLKRKSSCIQHSSVVPRKMSLVKKQNY